MANAKNTAKAEVTQSIKDKIAALLAKANGTDNEHEAAAFMNKAMELLAKYQLESWEVRDTQDPMGATVAWATNKNPVTWKKYLINAVANYYGAKAIMVNTAAGVRFDFVGRESARITAAEMYPFIIGQVKAWGAKLAETDASMNAKQHTRRVCHNLSIRITGLIAERMAEQTESKSVTAKHALVAVDELEAFLASLGTVKSKGGKIGAGTNKHREAANSVKLEKQVQGGAAAGTAQLAKASA